MRRTVGVIVASLLLWAAGCYQSGGVDDGALAGSRATTPEAHVCPAGCSLGLHLQLPAVSPYERYESSQFDVCHNDSCIHGRVEANLHSIFVVKRIYDGKLPDGMEVAISMHNEGLKAAIDLQLNGSDAMKLRDGDRYVFKVAAANGEQLHDFDSNVHYDNNAVDGCSMCPFEDQSISVGPIPLSTEGRNRD